MVLTMMLVSIGHGDLLKGKIRVLLLPIAGTHVPLIANWKGKIAS